MKHRSIIAFILLAAALVAAPQVSHDLAALKSALGTRIRGEILHAFLNLHASDAAPAAVARRAEPLLASCKAEAKSDAQATAARAKHSDERAHSAPQAEAAAQGDAGTQLAMLISPSLTFEDSSAEATGVDDKFILGQSDEYLHRAAPGGDLAMLVPPDMGLDARQLPQVAGDDARETRARDERRRSAESRRREYAASARFETASAKSQGEEVLKNLGPLLRDAVWFRATQEGTKVRVLKLRLPAKARGAKAPAAAPQPAPAASDKSLPATPAWVQTSAGE
jgi:hypothetical protein